jgi:hypothetical protein
MAESINDIDDIMILGYFESIRSVFFTKLTLLSALTNTDKNGKSFHDLLIDFGRDVDNEINDKPCLTALRRKNPEVIENLKEDLCTSSLLSAWIIFEQVIKHTTRSNYALNPNDLSLDYYKRKFAFTKREKKDLDLFCYLRNSIVHYNGAYYAYKKIDHTYNGIRFKSIGLEGIKIDGLSIRAHYKVIQDIQKYTLKAWTASQKV